MPIKRSFFRDILRDTNSRKFSMTKFAAFTAIWLLVDAVVTAIIIMIIEKEIDHILKKFQILKRFAWNIAIVAKK